MSPAATSQVFVADSSDRAAAIRSLFEHADLTGSGGLAGPSGLADPAGSGALSGKRVVVKANFNSADPFPASTHPDTLGTIVTLLQEAGAREITLVERSGMGDTRSNLEKLGILALAGQLGFTVVVL